MEGEVDIDPQTTSSGKERGMWQFIYFSKGPYEVNKIIRFLDAETEIQGSWDSYSGSPN